MVRLARPLTVGMSLACLLLGCRREPLPAMAPLVGARVEALLARMTLEEKAGQLNLQSFEASVWDDIVAGRVGALSNMNHAGDIARAQLAVGRSRLQIPLLFSLDVLHGFRTQFPVPLAEAAAFDPALAERVAQHAAREASYVGIQWTFAPMADVARDVRWGRVVEGFGEDPFLGSVLTAARVRGFRAGGLAATVKHFAGYGAAQGGRDYDTTFIPTAELYDVYLPPFRAGIKAGAVSVMAAFNALNGLPASAHPWLIRDVLHGQWGFGGFVTSDFVSITELIAHGVAASEAEAARKALLAGVDMDMQSGLYVRHVPAEVRAGRLSEAALDQAVRRVLRVKEQLGLFDRPPVDAGHEDALFPTAQARALAREAARESMVLLSNGAQLLPLANELRSLAVVGPLADAGHDQLGPHIARGQSSDSVSLLAGLRARAEERGLAVAHAPGCRLEERADEAQREPPWRRFCQRTDLIAQAAETARAADLVIAIMGEPAVLSGEAASRAHLTLPGRQPELLEALLATGKPVVLVLVAGRPQELGSLGERVGALLMAFYPGTEGGTALADVLFGEVSPGGKLPVTWPRTIGQLPFYYNALPSGRLTSDTNRFTLNYIDETYTPLYPFGHGLSYTQFELRAAPPVKTAYLPSELLTLDVTLRNVGERKGSEVVQLYTRDPVASRSRPLRELKAFQKVWLAPGEQTRVRLSVAVQELGFHRDDGRYVVEPGTIELYLGTSSRAPKLGEITIVVPRAAAGSRE